MYEGKNNVGMKEIFSYMYDSMKITFFLQQMWKKEKKITINCNH